MKTSIKLCEYDDILEPRDIYSLLCLTSIRNKFYGICSKAFVKVRSSLLPTYLYLPYKAFFIWLVFLHLFSFSRSLFPHFLPSQVFPIITSLHYTSLHYNSPHLISSRLISSHLIFSHPNHPISQSPFPFPFLFLSPLPVLFSSLLPPS